MTSDRLLSLRERIANDPDASNIDSRDVTPEPTTANGTVPGHALYDTPPRGEEQSSLIVEGSRLRRPTSGSSWYNDERTASRSRSVTSKYNSDLRTDREPQQHEDSVVELTDASAVSGRTSKRSRQSTKPKRKRGRPSKARGHSPGLRIATQGRDANPIQGGSTQPSNNRVRVRDAKQQETQERRRMAQDLRSIQRSPTPGSTDHDEDEPRLSASQTQRPADESNYTYVYEAAGYETLAAWATTLLDINVEGWEEEEIVEAIKMAQENQADEVRAPQPETEVVMLETEGLSAGGGWLNAENAKSASTLGKRAAEHDSAGSSLKRIRMVDPNDTATEPESDEEAATATNGHGSPPHPPPPPPVHTEVSHPPIATLGREDTAATVLDVLLEGQPPSSSQSLGGAPSRFPTLPNFLSNIIPARGPAHERLKKKVVARDMVRDLDRERREALAPVEQMDEQMDELEDDRGTSAPPPSTSPIPPSPPLLPVPPPSPAEATRPSQPLAGPLPPSAPRVQRTYGRNRTHAGLGHDGPAPDGPNAPPPSPTRPHRTRSVLDLMHPKVYLNDPTPSRSTLKAARVEAKARARLFGQRAEPSSSPRISFNRPVPDVGHSASQSLSQSRPQQRSRRLHPVAAAQADLAAFNDHCARDNAPTFSKSVTRQTSRRPRVAAPNTRYPSDLLQDDDEDHTHAEALRAGTQPTRGRKKKPLARDVHGPRRQVLTYAKLHLFAYALVEGMYQTRGTYMLWAAYVHEATWRELLPMVPYRAATSDELEIMVNYIATLRGKVKDKVRAIIELVYEFDGRVVTQEDIQANLDRFNLLHPNTFHCTSFLPRRGHYESEHLARCIAAALFQGPNSVGVLFPDYFNEMPLSVVAFILSVMDFCIQEWEDGYFASHDLGAAKMLDKYETHMDGLKELQRVAPNRMQDLQDGWTEYAFDYCGASFIEKNMDRDKAVFHAEFRPDTPPPEAPAETSFQATSLRPLAPESSRVLPTDHEEERYSPFYGSPIERTVSPNPFFSYPRAETPHNNEGRSPSPGVEYNEHGYRTARSSGKRRAD